MNERYRRSRQRLLAIGIMAVVLGALIVTLSAAEELWRTDDADPLTTLEPGTDPDADLLAGETRPMVAAECGDLQPVAAFLAAGSRAQSAPRRCLGARAAPAAGRAGCGTSSRHRGRPGLASVSQCLVGLARGGLCHLRRSGLGHDAGLHAAAVGRQHECLIRARNAGCQTTIMVD